jgi:demethylspheroidene O-methyltransferase
MIGNPGIAAMIEHHAVLYADLQDPIALLKRDQSQTGLGGYWPYARTDQPATLSAEQVSPYSKLMAASQAMIAEEVIAAYPFRPHHCLLDVGGGEGAFVSAVGARWPKLRFMLFDLPAVVEQANQRFLKNGMESRVSTTGGDFFADPLPVGADIISLVRVLHDHDDENALRLLKAAHRALPEQGTLLVAEPMSGTPGAEPIGDAYFGFYLLAMGQGRPRTQAQIESMLSSVGFTEINHRPTRQPMLTNVISAKKLTN